MRVAGGLVALLLVLVLDVSLVWLLVILALLAAYQFSLYTAPGHELPRQADDEPHGSGCDRFEQECGKETI
jgi:hypothetical protein